MKKISHSVKDEPCRRDLVEQIPTTAGDELFEPARECRSSSFDKIQAITASTFQTWVGKLLRYFNPLKDDIDNAQSLQILYTIFFPALWLILFPLLIAARFLLLITLPVICMIPLYHLAHTKSIKSSIFRILLALAYLALVGLTIIPYLITFPFYVVFEVIPTSLISIPLFLTALPLTGLAVVGSAVLTLVSARNISLKTSRGGSQKI